MSLLGRLRIKPENVTQGRRNNFKSYGGAKRNLFSRSYTFLETLKLCNANVATPSLFIYDHKLTVNIGNQSKFAKCLSWQSTMNCLVKFWFPFCLHASNGPFEFFELKVFRLQTIHTYALSKSFWAFKVLSIWWWQYKYTKKYHRYGNKFTCLLYMDMSTTIYKGSETITWKTHILLLCL